MRVWGYKGPQQLIKAYLRKEDISLTRDTMASNTPTIKAEPTINPEPVVRVPMSDGTKTAPLTRCTVFLDLPYEIKEKIIAGALKPIPVIYRFRMNQLGVSEHYGAPGPRPTYLSPGRDLSRVTQPARALFATCYVTKKIVCRLLPDRIVVAPAFRERDDKGREIQDIKANGIVRMNPSLSAVGFDDGLWHAVRGRRANLGTLPDFPIGANIVAIRMGIRDAILPPQRNPSQPECLVMNRKEARELKKMLLEFPLMQRLILYTDVENEDWSPWESGHGPQPTPQGTATTGNNVEQAHVEIEMLMYLWENHLGEGPPQPIRDPVLPGAVGEDMERSRHLLLRRFFPHGPEMHVWAFNGDEELGDEPVPLKLQHKQEHVTPTLPPEDIDE